MHDADEPCEVLPWDSAFFGARIARVRGGRLTVERMQMIERWQAINKSDCLYFLADSGDPQTMVVAEEGGFRLVDVRLTFSRELDASTPVGQAPEGVLVRPHQATDVEPLMVMARANHRDTRFFFDPHFSLERAAELYATWIARDCANAAGLVLVAEVDGEAAGYLTCSVTRSGDGSIGLFGVGPGARGRGVGRALVEASLGWFADQGCAQVHVVTQGRNLAAQRLYQRAGFVTSAQQHWFHRWSS